MSRRVLGAEHPNTLKSASNLATVLDRQGEVSEATRIHRETLEVQRRVLGAEHLDTLTSANNLAAVLKAQGEFPEAARIHRETLEVRRRVLGAEHPGTRMSACDLAEVLRKERMTSAAIAPSAVWCCDRRDRTGLIVAALVVVGAVLWCAGGARSLGLHLGA